MLDNAHLTEPCTRVQYRRTTLPGRLEARQRDGGIAAAREAAERPGLPADLERHGLPDLVVQLNGQVDIELVGRVDSTKAGGLRTSFETVPDVPVTRFTLSLEGGKKGLLQNTESLCPVPGRRRRFR